MKILLLTSIFAILFVFAPAKRLLRPSHFMVNFNRNDLLSLSDSTVNYTDRIIAFWANENDVHSRKQLIATYYLIGNYSNAGQYLSVISQITDEFIQFNSKPTTYSRIEAANNSYYETKVR